MPGGCNAKCSFCFNRKKVSDDRCDGPNFVLGLLYQLKCLPDQFYQISITGNEPMISPYICSVMEVCKMLKNRYTNILLTTNGTSLLDNTRMIIEGVHHINISRHHFDEEINQKIFGGSFDVSNVYLAETIDAYSKQGVDVSLNCVINDNTTVDFINSYIDFAKKIGAYSIRFRKENGIIKSTPVEEYFSKDYPAIWHGECPACRTDLRIIRGIKTYWKSSVLEPSDFIPDKIYELVYDTDGKTYLDWNRKKQLTDCIDFYDQQRKGENEEHKKDYGCGESFFRSNTNRC